MFSELRLCILGWGSQGSVGLQSVIVFDIHVGNLILGVRVQRLKVKILRCISVAMFWTFC